MLYRALLICFISICYSSGLLAQGESSLLTRNSKGRYFYTHISNAAGVPKVVLYERMKQFAVDVLDASDNYMRTGEHGDDSLSTIVYITLDNSPEMTNQVVDFKVLFVFMDGMAIFRARDFMYRGRRAPDDVELSTPLYKMAELTPTAQASALAAFDETLRLLMAQMDKRVAGK